MHGHGHPELANKLNYQILKTVDKIWERVRAFIRGEMAANTTKFIRSPYWEKSASKANWSKNQNGLRNKGHRRGKGRSMGTYAPYARKEGFTPLTKTPKEILAMDNVTFLPPPPMVGTPEKRNMNKFWKSDQKNKGSTKGKEEVMSMVRSQGYQKRPYERVKHWMDNAIAFPSVPCYQLMDFSVIVDALIEGFKVRRIYVDGGNSSEIMYEHYFKSLNYQTRLRLIESQILLVGFLGEVNYPLGVIDLEVTIGESSAIHSMINFLTSNGIATVATTKETLREYKQIEEAHSLSRHARVTNPSLMQKARRWLILKLRWLWWRLIPRGQMRANINPPKNVDVFAWTPPDMTGIPQVITEDRLDTYPYIEPKVQKKRSLALDRKKVSNPVLVKKVDRSWRMCIDFKDLNKVCPKDLYPLPEIDWKIKSLIGFKYKFFLDAYKGYHQIQITKKDKEKTTFHTEKGVFYYMKMPFGLATYQRLVESTFKE
ncbi:hypothetical protein Tco_1215312 [Tanacetum coccineum]